MPSAIVIDNNNPIANASFVDDSFKIALNYNRINAVDSNNLGGLSLSCSFCNALHFNSEITSRNTTAFSSCCHKGKVHLLPYVSSTVLQTLFEGVSSNNSAQKKNQKTS